MKTQNKITTRNWKAARKKKWNIKNNDRHPQVVKHFRKRTKKIEVMKKETKRWVDELYKVHLEIAKNYNDNKQPQTHLTLEERAELKLSKHRGER